MIGYGDVCAVLVTRGDVDLGPILTTLPYERVVIWDNGLRDRDLKVFGRYVGIFETKAPVIYFQDDDCLVHNHDELLEEYNAHAPCVVGNFRRDPARERYFHDTTLLGWGSLFDRDLPSQGFHRYADVMGPPTDDFLQGLGAEFTWPILAGCARKVLVDIEPGGKVEWLEEDGRPIFARPNRMSQAPGFYQELALVLAAARKVRDS